MPRYIEYEALQSLEIGHLQGRPKLNRGDRIIVSVSFAENVISTFYFGLLMQKKEHVLAAALPGNLFIQRKDFTIVPNESQSPTPQQELAPPLPRVRNRSMADKATRKTKGCP